MIMTIDVGNTNITVGVFRGRRGGIEFSYHDENAPYIR